MSAAELKPPADWRGTPIDIGTVVIWHQSSSGITTWKIGRVVEITLPEYFDRWEPWQLTIEWAEESWVYEGSAHKSRGVKPKNVTVWPGDVKPADPLIPAQRNSADPG